MNGLTIVKKFLEENGYDGLVATGAECECEVSDLAPCGEMINDCLPGYKVPCSNENNLECGGCGSWHISTVKKG
jgi:hypothetical protein